MKPLIRYFLIVITAFVVMSCGRKKSLVTELNTTNSGFSVIIDDSKSIDLTLASPIDSSWKLVKNQIILSNAGISITLEGKLNVYQKKEFGSLGYSFIANKVLPSGKYFIYFEIKKMKATKKFSGSFLLKDH